MNTNWNFIMNNGRAAPTFNENYIINRNRNSDIIIDKNSNRNSDSYINVNTNGNGIMHNVSNRTHTFIENAT